MIARPMFRITEMVSGPEMAASKRGYWRGGTEVRRTRSWPLYSMEQAPQCAPPRYREFRLAGLSRPPHARLDHCGGAAERGVNRYIDAVSTSAKNGAARKRDSGGLAMGEVWRKAPTMLRYLLYRSLP